MTPELLVGIALGMAIMGVLDRTFFSALAQQLATARRRSGGR